MRTSQRKSAPGVKGGRVQKKNRHALSPDIYEHQFESIVFQRERPMKGFYHAVSVTDVKRWIGCIPDWGKTSEGISAVVLTDGEDWCFGRYHNAGVVSLNAWPKHEYLHVLDRKRWLLDAIGVELLEAGKEALLNPSQVKAFLLLGTFLHELGHHVDRMNTKSKWDAANGEPFAIAYEQRRQQELWPAYVREFGSP